MPATKKPATKVTTKPRPGRTAAAAPITAPTIAASATARKKQKHTLKLALKITIPIIIAACLYAIIYPFWPSIQYSLWPPASDASVVTHPNPDATIAAKKIHQAVSGNNAIIIPKIGVDMKIVEGTNETIALNQGAWRMPQTSTPDQGGNTVITGHRFKYRPPSKETFYLLDKLVVGDLITIHWQGYEYNYQVTSTKIVEPTAVEVLDNTTNPQITIITCTPLFTTKQRLIVIAEPI